MFAPLIWSKSVVLNKVVNYNNIQGPVHCYFNTCTVSCSHLYQLSQFQPQLNSVSWEFSLTSIILNSSITPCFIYFHFLIICHSFIPSLSALFNCTPITPASICPSLSLIYSVPLFFTLSSIIHLSFRLLNQGWSLFICNWKKIFPTFVFYFCIFRWRI